MITSLLMELAARSADAASAFGARPHRTRGVAELGSVAAAPLTSAASEGSLERVARQRIL